MKGELTRVDIIHILNGLKTISFKTLYDIYNNMNNKLYLNIINKKSSKKELIDKLIKIYNIKPYEITNIDSILFNYINYGKLKSNNFVNIFNKKIKNCSLLIKGRRDYMEDNILIKDNKKYYISLVLDGHGGKECSNFLKLNFYDIFLKKLRRRKNYENVILETLYFLDNHFLKNYNNSGSTLNLLFIDKKDKKYYIFNVGDSRCIALTKSNELLVLSNDHRPNKKENLMILNRGGTIKYNRVNGILAVTRAFGDKKLKPIISSKPDIKTGSINNIKYFFQGTDGIFDYISNKKIINMIEKTNEKYYNRIIRKILLYVYKDNKSQDNISCSFTLLN